MGEEKPDEELMGKRKLAPRFAYGISRHRYCKDGQSGAGLYLWLKYIFSYINKAGPKAPVLLAMRANCGTIAKAKSVMKRRSDNV
ncbi:hypothetical protein PA598K_00176 [Paenibacillus sp. 598K]|nr:hypothetical protein PA598K_00176 [Paenibacillus sp. 598K]